MEGRAARAHAASAAADLERHLRTFDGKGGEHAIANVDFIYMINLDARPEKYALARRCLEVHGISPYRFAAVDGWELSGEAIRDVGLKYRSGMTPLLATRYPAAVEGAVQSHEFMEEPGETYFMHCMPLGAIGCALSHLSVLQDAWDGGYETIWVMEDDIEVLGDPHTLSGLIAELDALVGERGWDVLFTDVDYRVDVGRYLVARGAPKRPDMDCSLRARYSARFTATFQLNEHFRKVAARFGSTSMVIRRSGIAKLLTFYKQRGIYAPYDLDNHIADGIQRYGLTFDLVTNMLDPISDVGVHPVVRAADTVERFLERYPEPMYQDLVVGSHIYRVGSDVCDARYELIKPVLERCEGPFSVLDVGAAQGYFSFRIAQDFPESTCVMVESDDTSYYARHGSMLSELRAMNRTLPNVDHIDTRLDRRDLERLGGSEHFDVVLALLVIHLFADGLSEQILTLQALLRLGDHLIVEVASDVGVLSTAYVEYLAQARAARELGVVRRHKDPVSPGCGRLFWFTGEPPPSDVATGSGRPRSAPHRAGPAGERSG